MVEIKEERFKDWKPPEFFHNIGNLYYTKYGWWVTCPENLRLGKGCDIGCGTYINAQYIVYIGENAQIGANCSIYSYDSERNFIGTIEIQKNVKIGANTVILPLNDKVHVIDRNIKAGSVVY